MFNANTSHPDCPVRIMYTPVVECNSVHSTELYNSPVYAGWNVGRTNQVRSVRPIAVIKCTEHGDYAGGSVERSNYRVILGGGERPGIIQIIGSHGYQALAYDATLGPIPDDEDLYEMLSFVDEYALVDDEDQSSLERELEDEAWAAGGARDFRNALAELFDTLDAGHEHELPDDDAPYTPGIVFDVNTCSDPETWQAALLDLWRAGCNEFNVNGGSGCVIETGCIVYFCIADWMAAAGSKRMPENRSPAARRQLQAALAALAVACRCD